MITGFGAAQFEVAVVRRNKESRRQQRNNALTRLSQQSMQHYGGQRNPEESKQLWKLLDQLSDKQGFAPVTSVVEVTGLCSACQQLG